MGFLERIRDVRRREPQTLTTESDITNAIRTNDITTCHNAHHRRGESHCQQLTCSSIKPTHPLRSILSQKKSPPSKRNTVTFTDNIYSIAPRVYPFADQTFMTPLRLRRKSKSEDLRAVADLFLENSRIKLHRKHRVQNFHAVAQLQSEEVTTLQVDVAIDIDVLIETHAVVDISRGEDPTLGYQHCRTCTCGADAADLMSTAEESMCKEEDDESLDWE
jgi:hypothetical protein